MIPAHNEEEAQPVALGEPFSDSPSQAHALTRQDAEAEVIRRWYLLPEHERESFEQAEAYAIRLDAELDFPTVTDRRRLIAAWLIRELAQAKRADHEMRQEAKVQAALDAATA